MGYQCSRVDGQAGGACAPTTGVCDPPGKGGQGQPCYANGGCKAGFACVEYWPNSGLKFCYFACDAGRFLHQSCSNTLRTSCEFVAGQNELGVCFTVAGVGQPCIPEVCEDGTTCLYDETQGADSAICYQNCDASACPANTQCQNTGSGQPVCVPNAGFKFLSAQCLSDAECKSMMCRTYRDQMLCTQPCSITDPASCPTGLKCLPNAGGTDGLCWPDYAVGPPPSKPPPTGFCKCDTTNACESGCDCDPDCKGKSCSCATAGTTSSSPLGLLVMVAMLFALRRRRR
jgi:MYXO-CTERM domain-containing protein